jgi:hypothetical protein
MSAFQEDIYTASLRKIAIEQNTPLDAYDMVKLHVLTDFFHILEEGESAIGGQPMALPHGPVVQEAYDLATKWAGAGGAFFVVNPMGSRSPMAPTDMSPPSGLWGELESAIDRAWLVHHGMNFDESQRFFHDEGEYFGSAWSAKKPDAGASGWGQHIDWADVVSAYEQKTGEDMSDVLTLLRAPSHSELVSLTSKAN